MRGGSSNTVAERDTYRAGVVILSPKDTRIKIALRFGFKASNNEAEYEAPVAGLQTAESHEAKHLTVLSDSMLLVNQVKGEYQVKGEKLSAYKTQRAEAEALATITEKKITKFVWQNIVCRFGVPHAIISDNGKQFDNANFRNFCEQLNIRHIRSSPAHPQSNGQVEAVNKIMKQHLKTCLESLKGAWMEELPNMLWAYRSTIKTATGENPFSLAFGVEVVIPVKISLLSLRIVEYNPATNDERLRLHLNLIEELREVSWQRIQTRQQVSQRYNINVRPKAFEEGDWVLRRVAQNTKETTDGVLGPNWEGSYKVIRVARPGTCYLANSEGKPLKHPWNVEHLKKILSIKVHVAKGKSKSYCKDTSIKVLST
ncbi:uncharacterized protein LOC111012723 [Momordica charantia]|uniref:Uncharacterized protein LOC111012723 n=1 Tax=Momordica charantia TaxID=3673 RepID=A0A6J1CM48_MOMCH|nr:uncharacterized protein LOC111012723 [Momordica charantia]